jgi:hypothetical protein
MGQVKGNTTVIEVAGTTLVSQRTLSWNITTDFLSVAGSSGKSKNRKPSGRYEMLVSLGGLYDPENPNASAKLLLDNLTGKTRAQITVGSDLVDYPTFLGYVKDLKEEMNQSDLVSYQATIVSDSTYVHVVIPWILAEGSWDDTGVWKDYEVWNDN